jgi:hypothetical protein
VIILNILGGVMVIVAVALAYGIRVVTGTANDGPGDGPEMILIGSIAVFFDVTYRIRQPNGHWISPFGGGNLFFIPVWGIGAIWIVVGTIYCFTRPLQLGLLGLTLTGLLIAGALGLAVVQMARCDRPNFSKFITGLNSKTSDENTTPHPKSARREFPCPACNLPCQTRDIKDGKCPWCGASV